SPLVVRVGRESRGGREGESKPPPSPSGPSAADKKEKRQSVKGRAAKRKKTTPPSSGLPLPKFSALNAASATVYFTLSTLRHLLSMCPSRPELENRDAAVFLKKTVKL
ncbi:hypothetical protein, partial [Faecalibacterium sp. An122]|uniref:hypothetical protein n=1 Tax=Faecalibacterium sp. An122 TaxID=1965551 RepID=UPI001950542E